jgi:hypothetical protein
LFLVPRGWELQVLLTMKLVQQWVLSVLQMVHLTKVQVESWWQ